MGVDDVSAIGQRARMIRRRRGLSLDVVGGLTGITGPYLSMLERGLRGRWSWLAPELGVGLKLSPRAGILRTPRW
jgi:transcriptional regulator with XRE-family HTH domain